MSEIGRRLEEVRRRIGEACDRAGRPASAVTLIAVSKTRTVEEIREAWEVSGQRDFGENRVQEAEEKLERGLPEGIRLHMIGHLQANKARRAARIFASVHSVDKAELADRLGGEGGSLPRLYCQVSLDAQPGRSGVDEQGIEAVLQAIERRGPSALAGLMCLPPYHEDPEKTRGYFRRLRDLRELHGGPERLPGLSMGMSHDYPVAIEEGATHVRVGEAIFGPRRGG